MGRGAVPKTGQSIGKLPFLDRSAGGSPHWDDSEVHEGRVAVPNPVANLTIITSTVPISFPSPRNPASELSVAGGAVPKTGQKPSSPRRNASGVPVGRGAVPKTCRKTPSATPECLWSTCGHGPRAEDRPEDPFATRGCH